MREQIAAQQEVWEETPATPYVRQQMSGYGAEKYADWEPVDRHASNALQLAQDTYYMKLPKSSSTVSVEDARGSVEAIWNSYDEAYRRANELALPAADVGDHREHSLQADFASDFVSFSMRILRFRIF